MKKFKHVFGGCLTAMLLFACSSTQVGLKENWIDERDVIALIGTPVDEWMVKAGRPSLVEISGDTGIFYYNYRPTMYATAVYDSTIIFKAWGRASSEAKPALENATEIWGSRKNIMQIKVVNNIAIAAVITNGPDKKTFIRDLNGNIILDPNSGFISNVSEEQKIGKDSKDFDNAFNSIKGKYTWPARTLPPPADSASTKGPWEDYRYRQQESEKRAEERAKEEAAIEKANKTADIIVPVAEHPAPKAAEHPAPKAAEHPAPKAAEHPAHKTAEHPAPKAAEHPAPEAAEHPAPKAAEHPAPKAAEHSAPEATEHPATEATHPVQH
jgi:hypothetical protein